MPALHGTLSRISQREYVGSSRMRCRVPICYVEKDSGRWEGRREEEEEERRGGGGSGVFGCRKWGCKEC